MAKITIKGYEINTVEARDSFDRRAVQYRNNIISILKKMDVTENNISVEVLPFAFKKAQAKAEWQFEGNNLSFDYDSASKFVDNLYVVQKIIELEVNSVISGEKDKADFIKSFMKEEINGENTTDAFNSKKRQSENLSDRHKFAKMNPSAKLNPKDQE